MFAVLSMLPWYLRANQATIAGNLLYLACLPIQALPRYLGSDLEQMT